MDFITKYLAIPIVQEILHWPYWPYALAALAVLVVLAAVVFFWVIRRKPGKSSAWKIGEWPLPASPRAQGPRFTRDSLVRVWHVFLRQLPADLRQALGLYQPFVVMGDVGSGKSRLISTCTDWEGQALQFYPSYAADPVLQICLGSRALVLEMPAALLNDTKSEARQALSKLWKALPRRQHPHVVLVFNGAALPLEDPENLRRLAQLMRGKINLLAHAGKTPVEVSLALTHMDQVEGFVQLAAFCGEHRLPLHAEWPPESPAPPLESALEGYEAHLPHALTTRPPRDYLRMVAFLKDAPQWLSVLGLFVKALQASDPFSPVPRVTHLTLHGAGQDGTLSNPFQVHPPSPEKRSWDPSRPHRLAAGALLAAGVLFFGGAFLFQYGELSSLNARLRNVEVAPPTHYRDLHALFPLAGGGILPWRFLPEFFPDEERLIVNRLVQSIRRNYLIPDLLRLKVQPDEQERLIYLVGLIFATRKNELGTLVLSQPNAWATPLSLPLELVVDYAGRNEEVPDVALDIDLFRLFHPRIINQAENALQWELFFRRVNATYREPFITKQTLKEIQQAVGPMLKTIQRIFEYPLLDDIVAGIKTIAPFGNRIEWIQQRDIQIKQKPLRDFLADIDLASLDIPSTAGLSLASFLDVLKTLQIQPTGADAEYKFTVGTETFFFNRKKGNDLILRSRMTFLMREFMAQNRLSRGFIFFGEEGEFPDVWLNASNDGTLFFTGKAKVDGRLTRSAFEKRVKPALDTLAKTLESLPVAGEEKNRFAAFVQKQVEVYADRYTEAYRNFYTQFHIRADSEGALRHVLGQIAAISSPFLDFLTTLDENTALDAGETPYVKPLLQKLGIFSFVHRVMKEKDGVYPEWEKYKAFVQGMKEEIDGDTPFRPTGKGDDAAELKSLLPPLARISFGVFRGDEGTYISLVKAWLKSAGIDIEWQAPFLEPFQLAFFIGKGDVEASLARIWSDLDAGYIDPLRAKFPFNPAAEAEISPDDLQKTLHPQGAFWKSFRSYLAPACVETAGVWTERISPQGVLKLPDTMLVTANDAAKLAKQLWDDKGAQKPIAVGVKPQALPGGRGPVDIPVLTYLRSDKATAFAFNQQPAWQRFDLEWWKVQSASVGMGFDTPPNTQQTYREVAVSDVNWAFYRLLAKGQVMDQNVVAWRLDSPWGGPALILEFTFKSDPWTVFKLPEKGFSPRKADRP